jgi:hypothetical protein
MNRRDESSNIHRLTVKSFRFTLSESDVHHVSSSHLGHLIGIIAFCYETSMTMKMGMRCLTFILFTCDASWSLVPSVSYNAQRLACRAPTNDVVNTGQREEVDDVGFGRRQALAAAFGLATTSFSFASTLLSSPPSANAFDNKISSKYDDRPKRRGPQVQFYHPHSHTDTKRFWTLIQGPVSHLMTMSLFSYCAVSYSYSPRIWA